MSFDVLGELNWAAVAAATAAYFVLGGIWYAERAFGGTYRRSIGFEPRPGWTPGPLLYVAPLVSAFVASVATAMLATATGSDTLAEGVVIGLVVGAGYGLAIAAVAGLNQPRPGPLFLVFGAYHLVGLTIVAVIVSAWR